MEVDIGPGKYIVAVSGGVDSVVLLHLLVSKFQFVVAHFDHGIRKDSDADRQFVQNLAEKNGLAFEFKREELGKDASEALARERRYRFLNEVKAKHHAEAIITAHHMDDVLETACINILRGTFRKGLSALASGEILRPLLAYKKEELVNYAKKHNLQWREDVTNEDTKYLRNFVRSRLAPADPHDKNRLMQIIEENKGRNEEIDRLVSEIFEFGYDESTHSMDRRFFISLPYNVSCEILAFWLRKNLVEFDKKNIELLAAGLKTGQSSSRLDVGRGLVFKLSDTRISLQAV